MTTTDLKQLDSLIINNYTNSRPCANNEIRLDLTSPIDLINKKVALGYLGVYYSWRNITASNNNNKLQYIWVDGITYDVIYPDGFYTIDDMSSYFRLKLRENLHFMLDGNGKEVFHISFTANPTYYCTTFSMLPVVVPVGGSNPNNIVQVGLTPQILIPNTNIKDNLGALAGNYPPNAGTNVSYSFNSQNVPQISPITTINLTCNLVNNNSNQYRDVIYQFAPTTGYATYLTISPYYPIFYNILDGKYNKISLFFYDQNYKPIPLIDRNITATILFS
jgi:hypothetical protein